MAGYQQAIIVGNVGRDPNFKYTQSGIAVCDFSVAVTRRTGSRSSDQQGQQGQQGQQPERQEKTTWFRVTCWRDLAEIANSYVRKGMQVMVVGTIEVSSYMDKNNQPAATLELTAQTFQMLGTRADNQGQGQGSYEGQTAEADNLSDIPF